MANDVETIFKTEQKIRISIAQWDEGGVYLHIITRHGTLGFPLTHNEAEQMVAGFQKALHVEVMA